MSSMDYNFEFVPTITVEDDMKILKQEVSIMNGSETEVLNEFQIVAAEYTSNKINEFLEKPSQMIKCGDIILVENKEFFLTCNCNKKFISLSGFSEHYLKNHTTKTIPDGIDLLLESSCIELLKPSITEDFKEEFEEIYQQTNVLKLKNMHEETEYIKEFESQYENEEYMLPIKKNRKATQYKSKQANKESKVKHPITKDIVCEICGKNLPNKSTMIRHQRTHTGERPFKCRHCGKGFNYKNHCERHELLHVKEKIYECDYCYLKFSRTDHKKVHETSHTIEDKEKVAKLGKKLAGLTCTNPNESETTKTTEKLIQLDDSVPDGYWRCKICEKILKNSYKREDHHRLHTGEKPFICDICGKGMFSQSNLLRHVATHTQNRRYRCTKCPAAFYCSTHLKRHEISHNSEKQFKCEMCDMKFWRKEHLTAHQVRHLTDRQRNHKCDICEKSYLDVNALRHHKKKHTSGNDSFMCITCPAVFQLKEALKRHEKRHINKGMYKCDFCPDKRFNDKDDKNQHEKRCHLNLL